MTEWKDLIAQAGAGAEHVCYAVVDVFGDSFEIWCTEHNADKQGPLTEEQIAYLQRLTWAP